MKYLILTDQEAAIVNVIFANMVAMADDKDDPAVVETFQSIVRKAMSASDVPPVCTATEASV